MKPVFAIHAGLAVYFTSIFFDFGVRQGFSDAKATFGSLIGAVVCGGYFIAELRRMMRATEPTFEDEKKWVESVVRPGMSVQEATDALRARFEAKKEAAGFSLLAGPTRVHDFASAFSDVRLVSKSDSVISVRVEVAYEKRA